MCPGHEPGIGTNQKPSWDKQGVALSLADMRQAPPTRCHSTQARDSPYIFLGQRPYPWYKEEWLAAGWQRASQNHRHRCHGGGTPRGSCHQSCQQSHSSYSVRSKKELTEMGLCSCTGANRTFSACTKVPEPTTFSSPRKPAGWVYAA